MRLPGLHWVLDPSMVPAGLFRPGLSPHSDLVIRYDSGAGRLVVQATLVPSAEGSAVSRCQARLVDPEVRRVRPGRTWSRPDLRCARSFSCHSRLMSFGETWLEVLEGPPRPASDSRTHLIRRALRWADAALRADRAPVGLAPRSTSEDWATLADLAWEECRRDWAAADDPGRAAAVPEPTVPLPGPVCLAEVLGE